MNQINCEDLNVCKNGQDWYIGCWKGGKCIKTLLLTNFLVAAPAHSWQSTDVLGEIFKTWVKHCLEHRSKSVNVSFDATGFIDSDVEDHWTYEEKYQEFKKLFWVRG